LTSNCNNCDIGHCKNIRSEFPKFRQKHHLSAEELRSNCGYHVPTRNLKMPILASLLYRDETVGVVALLTKFKFEIEELDRHPYFKLKIRK